MGWVGGCLLGWLVGRVRGAFRRCTSHATSSADPSAAFIRFTRSGGSSSQLPDNYVRTNLTPYVSSCTVSCGGLLLESHKYRLLCALCLLAAADVGACLWVGVAAVCVLSRLAYLRVM